MIERVNSADGTEIAYEHLGEGPAVILVAGIFCTRQTTRPLAELLAADGFSVINPDRRGRGDSTEAGPYAVEREIEDLAALVDAAAGRAHLYGHSSGAALALEGAAAGLPIDRLVLHEPPYGGDDPESLRGARELGLAVEAAIAAGRPAAAIGHFFTSMGMPAPMIEAMQADSEMLAVVPTMPYDLEVTGNVSRGGAIPVDLARAIVAPTLLLAGDASPDFFLETSRRLAQLLADGSLRILAGQDHGAPASAVAPAVAEFLRAPAG